MPSVEAQLRKKRLKSECRKLKERKCPGKFKRLMNSLRDFQDAENDKRTVFIRNVHFSCTLEQLQRHFESCGTISEVTISKDKSGRPKGCAVVEFLEVEAVQKALLLHESQLCGCQIMVGPSISIAARNAAALKLQKPAAGYQPYQLNNNSDIQHIAKNVSLGSSSNREDTQTLKQTM